jgi:hypothetical protein
MARLALKRERWHPAHRCAAVRAEARWRERTDG